MEQLLNPWKPIDEALADFADRQRNVAQAAGFVSGSIDDKRLGTPGFEEVPSCIYFYYVRVNLDGRVVITHHFFPGGDPNSADNPKNPADWPAIERDSTKLTPILEMLAHDARPSGAHVHPPIGSGFKDITWRRKSYIAFFIDEANWALKPKDGVVFVTDPKGGVLPGTPNHTFFDALHLPLTMRILHPDPGGPATDQRSAVVFINHMKADEAGRDIGRDAAGNPLPPPQEKQLFHFQMVFDVAIEGTANRMTVIFDPDGQNLGPPLPPP